MFRPYNHSYIHAPKPPVGTGFIPVQNANTTWGLLDNTICTGETFFALKSNNTSRTVYHFDEKFNIPAWQSHTGLLINQPLWG